MQVNSVDRSPNWTPTGANLYSTGASQPTPSGTPAAVTKASTDAAATSAPASTSVPTPAPGAASPSMESADYGMTIKLPTVEKPQTPPAKPVYMRLIDNLQAMWRASGNAVDVVAEASKAAAPATHVQGPLVYPDPKTKKVSNN